MPDEIGPGAHVHLMGIGGFGINPIARVMHELGYHVSGCDVAPSPLLNPVREMGIPVELGHQAAHLDAYAPDALVVSSAIPADNPELRAAARRGIPILKRADVIYTLMEGRSGVAVAGTHGKTTTSAMLAWTLFDAGLDPSFIVGGVLANLDTNARAGNGRPFVIEADEYDRMFMGLCPRVALVTMIEMDHPDMFADLAEVRALFQEFVGLLPEDGLLIAGYDDPEARQLAEQAHVPAITYGLLGGDWVADTLTPNARGGMDFIAVWRGRPIVEVSLRVPGVHNVQNALGVLAAAEVLGAPVQDAATALGAFAGVGRRFEVVGEAGGVTVVDDYAHHPTAIQATIAAARERFPGAALWAVWQPHTYSRTKALLDEFAASFVDADHVIVTDVYRSRDTSTYDIGPADVLVRMTYHRDTQHIGSLDEVVEYLMLNVQPGEVVLVLSAGDATRICDDLLTALGGVPDESDPA